MKVSVKYDQISQALTLKALPYVSLTFPPVGLQRIFLQPSQVMVD
jgi:hypothetical protein